MREIRNDADICSYSRIFARICADARRCLSRILAHGHPIPHSFHPTPRTFRFLVFHDFPPKPLVCDVLHFRFQIRKRNLSLAWPTRPMATTRSDTTFQERDILSNLINNCLTLFNMFSLTPSLLGVNSSATFSIFHCLPRLSLFRNGNGTHWIWQK